MGLFPSPWKHVFILTARWRRCSIKQVWMQIYGLMVSVWITRFVYRLWTSLMPCAEYSSTTIDTILTPGAIPTVIFSNGSCCVRRARLSILETSPIALSSCLALWDHTLRSLLLHYWTTLQIQTVADNGKKEESSPAVPQVRSHMRRLPFPSPPPFGH